MDHDLVMPQFLRWRAGSSVDLAEKVFICLLEARELCKRTQNNFFQGYTPVSSNSSTVIMLLVINALRGAACSDLSACFLTQAASAGRRVPFKHGRPVRGCFVSV